MGQGQVSKSKGKQDGEGGKIYINEDRVGHILGTHLIYFAKVSGLKKK